MTVQSIGSSKNKNDKGKLPKISNHNSRQFSPVEVQCICQNKLLIYKYFILSWFFPALNPCSSSTVIPDPNIFLYFNEVMYTSLKQIEKIHGLCTAVIQL